MANIETLKRGNIQIAPRTVAKAVTMQDGETLETKIKKKADKAHTLEGYGITDGVKVDDVYEIINGSVGDKQDTLVSGKNIKTINGESVLGQGDIVISSPTIKIDQTYNPESVNAQSGKAVAEAIANKQGKSNSYELIMKIIVGYSILSTKPNDWDSNFTAYYKNTGTSKEPIYTALTEFEEWENGKYFEYIAQDSKLNLVSDNDGNPFELSGVIIVANFNAATTARSLKFDFRSNTYSSAAAYKVLEVNIANGLQTTNGWYEACFESINEGVWKGNQNLNYNITPCIARFIPSSGPCRRIRFDCEIPAGSTITIYGVRA